MTTTRTELVACSGGLPTTLGTDINDAGFERFTGRKGNLRQKGPVQVEVEGLNFVSRCLWGWGHMFLIL